MIEEKLTYNIGVSFPPIRKKVISYIIEELKPGIIFDLGMGVGAYGQAIKMQNRNIRIIGLDACFKYLTSLSATRFYDMLIWGNVSAFLSGLIQIKSDIILFMDVVEHIVKDKAIEVLNFLDRVIISTPLFDYEQGVVEGNPLEQHLCWFTEEEINNLGYKTLCKVKYDERGDIGAFTKGL